MTSVNAHFHDWDPFLHHPPHAPTRQSFKGTAAPGLLCLPGHCSHLSEGSHGEGQPHPTPPPTPTLSPCHPWLLSDRVGGGSHQSCQPGEGNPPGGAGVSKASSGRGLPRPAPSPVPEARHPAPTRKVAAKRRARTMDARHALTMAAPTPMRDCQVPGGHPGQSARRPASPGLPGARLAARSDLPGDQRGRGPEEMSAGPGHTEGTGGLSEAARPQEIWGVSWPLRDHRSS